MTYQSQFKKKWKASIIFGSLSSQKRKKTGTTGFKGNFYKAFKER